MKLRVRISEKSSFSVVFRKKSVFLFNPFMGFTNHYNSNIRIRVSTYKWKFINTLSVLSRKWFASKLMKIDCFIKNMAGEIFFKFIVEIKLS